jgi:hypothetical protein
MFLLLRTLQKGRITFSLEETQMSTLMEDDIKRWTAKRKAALVMEIIQGKNTAAKASRSSSTLKCCTTHRVATTHMVGSLQ